MNEHKANALSEMASTEVTSASGDHGAVLRRIMDRTEPIVDCIADAATFLARTFLPYGDQKAKRDQLQDLLALLGRAVALRGMREAPKPANPVAEAIKGALFDINSAGMEAIKRDAVEADTFVTEVIEMNDACGRPKTEWNPKSIGLHTALQLEELREKLEEIAKMAGGMNPDYFMLMQCLSVMKATRQLFKEGAFDDLIDRANPHELLDGDIDLMVVSIGSISGQGADIYGALHAVSQANLAKLVDGKPLLDGDGKYLKPPGWKAADLTPFLHASHQPCPGKGQPGWVPGGSELPFAKTGKYQKE